MNESPSPWRDVEEILDEMSTIPEFDGGPRPTVNFKGFFGNTPLKVAAVRGDIEAIRLLVSAGAEIDSINEHGWTPLHFAVGLGHYEAASLLLQLGASTRIKGDSDCTVRDHARRQKDPRFRDLFPS